MEKLGTGIWSQLNQKSQEGKTEGGDRNAAPDYRPPNMWKKSRCEGKSGKEDEVDTSETKIASKFELQSSPVFNGKGRKHSNVSKHIHSVCKIAITIQEGSKTSGEWNEETSESHE